MTPRPLSRPSSLGAGDRGPFGLAIAAAFGVVIGAIFAWTVGVVIEVVGINVDAMWADKGVLHAQGLVEEDLRFISEYPRSVLVDDTLAFSRRAAELVGMPFDWMGVAEFYERSLLPVPEGAVGLKRSAHLARHELAKVFLIAKFVAQDVVIRMFVVIFALPAFLLACLLGAVDGLVRRDLRRWGGGRESSFVYHRALGATKWALFSGFSIYLAWPFGGFNPAYMVLLFTALVAAFLSISLSSFKKYV